MTVAENVFFDQHVMSYSMTAELSFVGAETPLADPFPTQPKTATYSLTVVNRNITVSRLLTGKSLQGLTFYSNSTSPSTCSNRPNNHSSRCNRCNSSDSDRERESKRATPWKV